MAWPDKGAMVRDLVVLAQGGDRDAFAALVQLTSDRMYALAARILRDNDLAEDALQGALITAWHVSWAPDGTRILAFAESAFALVSIDPGTGEYTVPSWTTTGNPAWQRKAP